MTCGSGQCCPCPFRSSIGGAAVSRPRPEASFRGLITFLRNEILLPLLHSTVVF